MPLAFVAQSDEDSAVGGLWREIWEEGTTSLSAALRMYMTDLVPLITAGWLPPVLLHTYYHFGILQLFFCIVCD